ncbi:hypothetical protein [Paenibacillus caui]|uniref:hypothetical protein n=1 Tax=Paenibacillus caui TaxID=2873927 RepID=UPI001CA7D67F|nr:hypothetical protein [Paenibacillus caui]
MKRYDTSLQADSTVAQAQNSVNKLHHSVSQAMSHPTRQMVEQAGSTLARTEQAVRQAKQLLGGPGAELAEDMLAEEKSRLAKLKSHERHSGR